MNNLILESTKAMSGLSNEARWFMVICGSLFCIWSLRKLRRRALLTSISSLFLGIGGGVVFFAVFPDLFNGLAYLVGIKYPPLLYLLVVIVALMVLVAHLASRLSCVDERCRRLAQEMALTHTESEPDKLGMHHEQAAGK